MFYIMRHGQTNANTANKAAGITDVPLNDTGRAQAASAAELIRPLGITRIISSDLLRAKETAQIVGKRLNVPVEYDPRIREWNYGNMENTAISAFTPAVFKLLVAEHNEFGAEPAVDIFRRIDGFLGELDLAQNILVVTHGAFMRSMMYYMEVYTKTGNKIDLDALIDFGFKRQIANAQVFAFQNKKFEPVR